MTTLLRVFFVIFVVLAGCGKDKTLSVNSGDEDSIIDTSGWDLSKIVPLDTVRALAIDEPMYIRTEFEQGKMRDLEVKFKGVVNNVIPPLSMIFLEVVDPDLKAIGGVASGMSGSPVIYKGNTVGALSYTIGGQQGTYYFFATPIQYMLDGVLARVPRAKTMTFKGQTVTPLAIPFVASGVSSRFSEKMSTRFSAKTGWEPKSGLSSAGLAESVQEDFSPGRPLAAAVVVGGEVNIAAVGTITYVDGNRLVAFGHPFFGNGSVGWPIIGARVLAEFTDLVFGPYKFFTLDNKVRGELTTDDSPGVGGRLGDFSSPLVPLTLDLTLADGTKTHLEHKLATKGLSSYDQSWYAFAGLYGPVESRLENQPNQSMRVHTLIRFKNSSLVLDRHELFAHPYFGARDLIYNAGVFDGWSLSYDVATSPDDILHLDRIECAVSIIDSALFATLDTAYVDSVAKVGTTLPIQVRITVGRTESRTVNFNLDVPEIIYPGRYSLEIAPGTANVSSDSVFHWESGDGSTESRIAQLNQTDPNQSLTATLLLQEADVDTTTVNVDSLSFTQIDSLYAVRDQLQAQLQANGYKPITQTIDIGLVQSYTAGLRTIIRLEK